MGIETLLFKKELERQDIIELLGASSKEEYELIREAAFNVMKANCGEKVYLRGLIEFSNLCINDCYYCGIRKSNHNVSRYTLNKDEILSAAVWSAEQGYGSVVLQSGERNDDKFVNYVEELVFLIKEKTSSTFLPDGVGITLCVGEQTSETYKRFFDAGAHRYLLRIETSNPVLFSEIHPESINFENRLHCLEILKEIGFQVGTGVMIGIPNQTLEDLADDILFFREMNIDMIGMGPYIVHSQTPMSHLQYLYAGKKEDNYKLSLNMIAVTRLVLKDVNIASTTALQAMYAMGREAGLMHGANIIMPMLTPTELRKEFQLYDGKPCIDEFSNDCFDCIQRRIESIGRSVALNEWGDSKHFANRKIVALSEDK
ncbi:MAG: [FeFe] hydrogenase H-cluster radical SAM maturase HydE [Bacteroidota bacterium]